MAATAGGCRRYLAARSNKTGVSAKTERARLQAAHNMPRINPSEWRWSTLRSLGLPSLRYGCWQIGQHPPSAARIASYSSGVILNISLSLFTLRRVFAATDSSLIQL